MRFPLGRLHGDDGDAELGGEALCVHGRPLSLGDIDHVQGDDRGQSEFEDLGDEVEIPLQMRGIHHAEDTARARRVLPEIHEDIARDALVGGVCTEAVAARQV